MSETHGLYTRLFWSHSQCDPFTVLLALQRAFPDAYSFSTTRILLLQNVWPRRRTFLPFPLDTRVIISKDGRYAAYDSNAAKGTPESDWNVILLDTPINMMLDYAEFHVQKSMVGTGRLSIMHYPMFGVTGPRAEVGHMGVPGSYEEIGSCMNMSNLLFHRGKYDASNLQTDARNIASPQTVSLSVREGYLTYYVNGKMTHGPLQLVADTSVQYHFSVCVKGTAEVLLVHPGFIPGVSKTVIDEL